MDDRYVLNPPEPLGPGRVAGTSRFRVTLTPTPTREAEQLYERNQQALSVPSPTRPRLHRGAFDFECDPAQLDDLIDTLRTQIRQFLP